MPVDGAEDTSCDALYAEALSWVGDAVDVYDVHTHIGHNDPDGFEADPEELVAALDRAGQAGALVFPMHEPGGYVAANDTVRAAAARWPDRLDWLCRVDPKAPGALEEATRCLDAGARGIKLHPRSEGFVLSHPGVEPLVALAASRGRMVLIHAGRGIPCLGEDVAALARAHPDVRIVLAHAGISDLGLLAPLADELPNLLYDSAWWQVGDVLQLLTTVPPGRVVYASDMPYGPPALAAAILIRCARETGLSPDVVREMLAPQGRRLVAGEPLLDLGPAPGGAVLGPRVVAFERAVAYAGAAAQMAFRGADATEPLALARLACQAPDPEHEHSASLQAIDAYLAHAERLRATNGTSRIGVSAIIAAQLVAGTPSAAAPPPPV